MRRAGCPWLGRVKKRCKYVTGTEYFKVHEGEWVKAWEDRGTHVHAINTRFADTTWAADHTE